MKIRAFGARTIAGVAVAGALAGIGAEVAEAKPRDGTCAAITNAAYNALMNADHYEREGDSENARYWMSVYRAAQQNITRRNC